MKNLNNSIYSQDTEVLPLQVSELGEKWKQLSLLKTTTTRSQPSKITGQKSRSTKTQEIIIADAENLTLLPQVSPVQGQATREPEQVWNIPNLPYLEKPLELSTSVGQSSALSSSPWELSIADLEQSLEDSEWSDIKVRLKLSRLRSLEQDTSESGCLLFPTPTSNLGTYRKAGQTKLEQWLRSNGLIPLGSQLNAIAYAQIMGLPMNWFRALGGNAMSPQSLPVPPEPKGGSEPENSQAEPLRQDKQQSLLEESYTSTHSPDPELSFSKKRRERGEGSGCIVMRYVTKKGKSYEQFWYDYELWSNGVCLRKGSVYIPKKLLHIINKMEMEKQPVMLILDRLGKNI